ncbi:sigma-70 family RNA polymerase sigma factor [Dehalobacterium formicoaceticum]|uniref:Sigma-70 family RNA polymerase sigma factor n=1 Tax=Dehalobacterium formicoaceticum TaxID=51515 RepID=A0ABT1Y338_9FIRM|nr:sigma-70 family RNA polymerase sigma factor [Dehalobacterium formicoaceticum]MCR6544106.1 sigma-70 family RNA polymerase sigma factor [Dehalobacterium formicoaceticum]
MTVSQFCTDKEITDLYNRHVDMVYRISLMLLKNIADAEDATQTTFIKLIASNTLFSNEEHEKRWLIFVTKNICKDMLKSAWHSKRSDWEHTIKQPCPDMNDTDKEDIWRKVTDLDEKYKLPLYLYYYEGYRTEEIATMFNINHATVRTRLRTARKKLKLQMEDDK